VASLTACGPGRAAPAKESTAKRVSNPDEVTTPGRSRVTYTTAAPLHVGPPLAPGGAGASGSTSATKASAAAGTGSEGTASEATGPTAAGAAAGTAPSPPASCGAHDLRVSFDLQPAGGTQPLDRTRALIVLTDLAAGGCSLQGYAAVDAMEADHWKALDPVHVAQPGSPGPVILEGGGSAFAGMEWTDDAGCPEVSAFRLVLSDPGAALPVVVAAPDGESNPVVVCATDVELGPFAVTSQGTVDFPDSVGAGT
jgi:hypothetical protein